VLGIIAAVKVHDVGDAGKWKVQVLICRASVVRRYDDVGT
jgi:hypothetical protein